MEKNLVERMIQYIKDRTEGFDDNFPRNKELQSKTCEKSVKSFPFIL